MSGAGIVSVIVPFLNADRGSSARRPRVFTRRHTATGTRLGRDDLRRLALWFSRMGRPEDRERDHVESLGIPVGMILRPTWLLRHYDSDISRALRWQRFRYAHPTACRVARRIRRA